jgi:glucosamine kinase
MTDQSRDYVLAIDGGQSNTSCLVGRLDGTLLGSGSAGPAAVPSAELSAGLMRKALFTAVNEALAAISPRSTRIEAAYLSLTGGISAAEEYLPTLIPIARMQIESDAVAALASGTCGGPGAALISGTGCVTYARNRRGETTTGGGWGYLLGDEGSGFWIGLQAIRAAIRAADGRAPKTAFTTEVMRLLGVDDMRQAQANIYNDAFTRPEIAQLAPQVMAWAEHGDETASAIIRQAAEELAALVVATCQSAGFTLPEEKVIVPAGGVMHPNTPVFKHFSRLIADQLPDYRIIIPRFPPVAGAFILGLQLAGVCIDAAILDNIEHSLRAMPEQHLKI